MVELIKPQKLNKGDIIATVSPCWGISGHSDVLWKYNIGKMRLESLGLQVVSSPNSQKGEDYLKNNPQARAEDLMWAFENPNIKAIIANIGGNDSEKVLPFLDAKTIQYNPKIFIGCSDVMNFHLFCYKAGLSTFYGHNLLPTIAETPQFHPYSRKWLIKVLFDNSVIGEIKPSTEYSCDENNYFDKSYAKVYKNDNGFLWIQGTGKSTGKLFGGHTGLKNFSSLSKYDFENVILFLEDIPEFFAPSDLADFLDWLGKIGALQVLNGLIIGKLCSDVPFDEHKNAMLQIVNYKYGIVNLPIVANMNFGHTSPIFILPYGAMAEIDCDNKKFSILENGVV